MKISAALKAFQFKLHTKLEQYRLPPYKVARVVALQRICCRVNIQVASQADHVAGLTHLVIRVIVWREVGSAGPLADAKLPVMTENEQRGDPLRRHFHSLFVQFAGLCREEDRGSP